MRIHSRIPHAKNQLPTPKTVTCREGADKETDKQTEIANTEGPIEFFWSFLFLDFFIDERSNKKLIPNNFCNFNANPTSQINRLFMRN